MKERHRHVSLGRLCLLFGITRQSYYHHYWHIEEQTLEHELVTKQVIEIRSRHPRMGGRKLFHILEPFMVEHQIKMGRDAFFNLLAANGMLVKRRNRRNIRTTFSSHWLRKWPNLIVDYKPVAPNRLWVSDITYWKSYKQVLYLSLITDAYSHKIVGYHLGRTLEAEHTIKALQMALKSNKGVIGDLIHHSDRGVQYCCSQYVKLLQDNCIRISMTETGDPLENPVAERMNGILKDEYLECYEVNSFAQAKKLLDRTIQLYNDERPHMNNNYNVPAEVHMAPSKLKSQNYDSQITCQGSMTNMNQSTT